MTLIFITKSQCCNYKVNKIKPKKFIKKAKKVLFVIDINFHNKITLLSQKIKPKKFVKMCRKDIYRYRDSPLSAVFWSPGNCTIGKPALIPFFAHFLTVILSRTAVILTIFFSFWTQFSKTKLKCKNAKSFFLKNLKKKVERIFLGKKSEGFLRAELTGIQFFFFFVLGSYEYLERLEGNIRKFLFFNVEIF